MNSQLLSSSPCLPPLCFLLVILLKIHSSSSNPCLLPFKCGNITAGYPFWGGGREPYCGHPDFMLECAGGPDPQTFKMIKDVTYEVLDINQEARTLKIAGLLLQSFPGSCTEFPNIFSSELFNYFDAHENVTLHYYCPPQQIGKHQNCQVNYVEHENDVIQANGVTYEQGGCNTSFSVPVPKFLLADVKASGANWEDVLNLGFELQWKIGDMTCEDCTKSKGNCSFDHTSIEYICQCPYNAIQPFSYESCHYKPPPPGTHQAPKAPPGTHLHH